MEQNNFEKKIQQKLGELNIPPSDKVWENVEKHITKRNDRKRILLFLLLFVSIAVGGYFISNSIKNNKNSQNYLVSTSVEKNSKQTKKQDSSLNQTIALPKSGPEEKHTSEENKKQFKKITNNKIEQEVSKEPVILENSTLATSSEKKNTENKEPHTAGIKSDSGNKQSVSDRRLAYNQKNNLTINSAEKVQKETTLKKNDGEENIQDKVMEIHDGITLQNKIIPVNTLADTNRDLSKKADKSINKLQTTRETHKWELGITLSGGTSMIGGGGTPGSNNLSSSASMDFITFPSNNYMLSPANNHFTPSPIKNSFAFTGGIFLDKNISRKNKMDLGISYKYYSLINTTGNKIDFNIDPSLSGNDLYSSWSNVNTYRNNFHYIEIPVSFKFQLGNSKSLPIFWSVGASISQLISSNALQFKSSPGLYYNDNSLYYKTQVGLQTGFSAVLFANAKVPIGVGPYFIYNMSKMANQGIYSGKHFSFIGIKAEILLGKK